MADSPAALARLLAARRNGLTDAAVQAEPAVAEVLAALNAAPGTLLARMSGSGATCFALFETDAAAAAAATILAAAHSTWWVKAGRLAGGA